VITARSGTPLAEIEAALRAHNQMLPFEPPHFGRNATLGGCIAAGLAGPRRAWTGAPRDFVLGAVVMNGHGQVLHFGGQVVKNVAGYDVSRLLAGSLGTLGLILELSIKVLPRPVAEATLKFDMHATDGVRKLNEWGGHPLPICGSAWRDGTLALRLAGAEAAVKTARNTLGGEVVDAVEADRFWIGMREQTDPFFAVIEPRSALWRLALPSIAEPLHLPGAQLMEWGGAQRWWITDTDPQTVRISAKQAGGHATIFRAGSAYDRNAGVFTPLPAPLMKIHRGLKAAFDPARIFNRARLYPDF
jgi:glycolate oxidase FAD binding subunit